MDQNVTQLSDHVQRRAGRLNDHIASGIMFATEAVLDLVKRGFTVLGVTIGGRKPAIRIQRCAQCADLNGVCFRRVSNDGAREDTMVAVVRGCQVQWRGD